jgi:hypothetical protein
MGIINGISGAIASAVDVSPQGHGSQQSARISNKKENDFTFFQHQFT